MKKYGIFDILGPVMIGPSSSHTAGANRIGQVARQMIKDEVVLAEVTLFSSFAKTGKGHGTDSAIIGGLIGLKEDDEKLKYAFEIAKEMNFNYVINFSEEFSEHPNTVEIKFTFKNDNPTQIKGVSVGGGAIKIVEFNHLKVDFTGEYFTVIACYKDSPGVIHKITGVMAANNINIGFMEVSRENRGQEALMVMECDKSLDFDIVDEIRKLIDDVYKVYILTPIKDGE